jgi:triacylglycerol lipase/cholesterol oxidase
VTEGISVAFDEAMNGFVDFGPPTDYRTGYARGREDETRCGVVLTITAPDIAVFTSDPKTEARAEGSVDCPVLGGVCVIERGTFNLLVEVIPHRPRIKDMRYRLVFRTPSGRLMTLVGTKFVDADGILRMWPDTTTLYTKIFEGDVPPEGVQGATVVAVGILRLTPLSFARQLFTFRSNGATLMARLGAMLRFGKLFAARIWQVYGPKFLTPRAQGRGDQRS